MKHLTWVKLPGPGGNQGVAYIGGDGYGIDTLARFDRHLDARGNSRGTRDRYIGAAGRFIDYLIKCRAFGVPARPSDIAEAIDAYPVFLRDGLKTEWPEFPTLSDYAREIGFVLGLAHNSMTPTLPAVNHFLRFAHNHALRTADNLGDRNIVPD